MARRTNEEIAHDKKLKEQCQMLETYFNTLEEICKSTNVEQKEDLVGTIGLNVGKAMMVFMNIEELTGVFDEDYLTDKMEEDPDDKKPVKK